MTPYEPGDAPAITDITKVLKLAAASVKSSYMVEGLVSGTKYYFRVAAVGSAGQGPWSDLVACIAG